MKERDNQKSIKPTLTIAGAGARIMEEDDLIDLSCDARGCASNCCTKSAPVVLNPYEIALICREASMSYEDLLDIVETDRAKSFPLVMLPRDPVCSFWTGKGCRIYAARPLACRLYPLGRVYDGGRSLIVQPELNICPGLAPDPLHTVADYLRVQDTDLLVHMADQWIEFVNDMERMPLPDRAVTSVAFHLLVYSPDTPPAPAASAELSSIEDVFLLRLDSARSQIPRFLKIGPDSA
ncbi:MAG TPA: YkgJ family cysteine cluster protein [Nitrospirota bacterium]|nr:YkgJ family cysteine cluster protein [Nitrospirota bacterium]